MAIVTSYRMKYDKTAAFWEILPTSALDFIYKIRDMADSFTSVMHIKMPMVCVALKG